MDISGCCNNVTDTSVTHHVLHHFTDSIATPILEDIHPEHVLIPLKLLKVPFLV